VANKRKKKSNWFKILLLLIFVPIFVWGAAFLIWLNWYDITALLGKENTGAKPATASRRETLKQPPAQDTHETIQEEDRRQLEDILKRR
jgi:cytoskeletal protein RodZ